MIVCSSSRSSSAIACSFSASLDPSRLGGRLSSQARYSSCSLTSAATATAHRLGPRRGARRRRWRGCAAVLAPPGAVPRLALGWGHWGDAEPMSGHLPPPIVNRDGHVSRCLRPSDVWCLVIPFLCSIGAPFLRPDLRFPRAARAAAVKTGRRPPPKAAQSGLDGGEHGARLGRVGGSAIMPPAAAPPSCARADRPCWDSDAARASSRGSRPQAPAPAAGNSRHWGRSAPHGCGA